MWLDSLEQVAVLLWLTLVITISIIGHELGHSFKARELGFDIKGITLFLLGGYAAIDGAIFNPYEEMKISFAGPKVNFILALFFLVIYNVLFFIGVPRFILIAFLFSGAINLLIGLFNLLPAYPLDGGRILRSYLSLHYGHRKATNIAHLTGFLMSAAFIALGVAIKDIVLIMVAVFICTLIIQEKKKIKENVQ